MSTGRAGTIIDISLVPQVLRLFPSLVLFAACMPGTHAQDSLRVILGGYAEVYFGYDLGRPSSGERPDFLYNHKRHNEVGVNLACLKAAMDKGRVRGNLALMAGTYVQYNLATEPAALRNIMEANVGVSLTRNGSLWLDAGVMPSHIGFESAVGADCWTLTRSLWAENTPYYEAGARLSWKASRNMNASLFLLNGWQRMQRLPGHTAPAFGTKLNLATPNGTVVNWSTFLGPATPDSLRLNRFYNNVYTTFNGDTTGLTLGFDLGLQERRDGGWDGWFGPVVVLRQRVAERNRAVARVEFFHDEAMVILGTDRPLMSACVGWDRQLVPGVLWRAEARWIGNERAMFTDRDGVPVRDNWVLTTALSARF